MHKPYEGTLTPAVEAFVNDLIQTEITPKRITSADIERLLKCPVVKAPLTIITLMGLTHFGDYTHPDEKIQAFIRMCFEQMKGSLKFAIAQLFSASWAGCAVAEWGPRPEGKSWILDQILCLRPATYGFIGTWGEIEFIRYHGVKEIDIPFERCLHVVNAPHFAFNDPRGYSDLESAESAVQAWRIITGEMVVAGQRQATPLTVFQYDPDSPDVILEDEEGNTKIDANGDPVTQSPQAQAAEQVKDIQNRSVLITTTNNSVQALSTGADINFFTEALRYCHKLILMSFLFPETGLEAIGSTGSGDSNLNKGHMTLLHQNVAALADQIKEVLLERMIRPLIEWNFGVKQESWGSFAAPPEKEEQRIELFNALVGALTAQAFSIDDLNVINKLYELAGLPQVDELPEGQKPQGFGLSAKDFEYWKLFETNGNGKAKKSTAL